MDLRSPPPRWEGPVLAFVVVVVTVYVVVFWLAWSDFAVQELRGGEVVVADTGFGC